MVHSFNSLEVVNTWILRIRIAGEHLIDLSSTPVCVLLLHGSAVPQHALCLVLMQGGLWG